MASLVMGFVRDLLHESGLVHLGWTGALALFFSSALLAVIIALLVRTCRSHASEAARRFRCAVPNELREKLQDFIDKVDPAMILDGAKRQVRAPGVPFEWSVVTDSPLPRSERTMEEVRVVLTGDCSVERTAPMVWSALVAADVECGPKGPVKSAALVVCHLSEKRLFDKGDDLINDMEKRLRAAVRQVAPWTVRLQ